MKVYKAVNAAAAAIKAIPQPFRNNINSKEALAAQEACGALSEVLEKELKPWLRENADEAAYKQIIKKYVDVVVLPTYKDLVTKNEALLKSVEALRAKPSNEAFKNAANAWLEAREPWETSEAFLFWPRFEVQSRPQHGLLASRSGANRQCTHNGRLFSVDLEPRSVGRSHSNGAKHARLPHP